MVPLRTLTAVLGLSLAASGCGIGCDDAQRVYVATQPGFQVTPAGAAAPTAVALYGEIGYNYSGQTDFQRVYDALTTRRRERQAVVMTAIGFETPPADRIVFALAVPGDAKGGDRFRVADVFPPPTNWEENWGFRPRLADDAVEVAFARTRASITNPPYDYVAHYTATAATGTVAVLRRDRDEMLLEVDVVVSDASGSSQRVAGRARLQLFDEGEVCPTLS